MSNPNLHSPYGLCCIMPPFQGLHACLKMSQPSLLSTPWCASIQWHIGKIIPIYYMSKYISRWWPAGFPAGDVSIELLVQKGIIERPRRMLNQFAIQGQQTYQIPT